LAIPEIADDTEEREGEEEIAAAGKRPLRQGRERDH